MFTKKRTVSLTLPEIRQLYAYTLSELEQIIQYRFIIGCVTAMNPFEYATVNGKNIQDKKIILTDPNRPHIQWIRPMHYMVEEIMEKYQYNLPEVRVADIRRHLPGILEKAGINKRVWRIRRKKGRWCIYSQPKYQLVTPDTARASTFYNMRKAGFSEEAMMLVLGRTNQLPYGVELNEEKLLKEIFESEFFKRP